MDIACKGSTYFYPAHLPLLKEYCFPQLQQPLADGLVEYDERQLRLTDTGHYFIRNICSAFDLHLQRNLNSLPEQAFSKAI